MHVQFQLCALTRSVLHHFDRNTSGANLICSFFLGRLFYTSLFLPTINRYKVDFAADLPHHFSTCLTFCPEAISRMAPNPCSFTLARPALAIGFKIGITVRMALLNIDPNPHPYEPRHKKICIRGFRPGKTQTGLHSHKS